jgi:NAD+ synthase
LAENSPQGVEKGKADKTHEENSRDLAPTLPRIRVGKEVARITSFISRVVGEADANGVVVALSGGIDSAVAGALCVKALGRKRVLGLLLPSDHTPQEDEKDAKALADFWGIKSERVPISGIAHAIMKSARLDGTRIARANIEARVRMIILYYYANSLGYLVAGTGDRSEALLGYYTKWGDGGVDFLPIAHLYKTQVRELGAQLGLPEAILTKPPSPQLWPGHKATDEIPAEYEKLDVVLHWLFDLKATPVQAASKAGVSTTVARRALEMNHRTEHKRALPPSLN